MVDVDLFQELGLCDRVAVGPALREGPQEVEQVCVGEC